MGFVRVPERGRTQAPEEDDEQEDGGPAHAGYRGWQSRRSEGGCAQLLGNYKSVTDFLRGDYATRGHIPVAFPGRRQ